MQTQPIANKLTECYKSIKTSDNFLMLCSKPFDSYEASVACTYTGGKAQKGALHCAVFAFVFVFVHKGAKWQSFCQRVNKALPFICAEFNQEIN